MRSLFAYSILFATLSAFAQASAQDLSGVWKGNDGGSYYIRQVGNEIWWFGENNPTSPSFSNVAHGKLAGTTIELSWGDVPKGNILQSGILVLKMVSNTELQALLQEGGFSGSVWTR
jgi:hypothetical protein